MKILFTTNVPSPYRLDFFNELGKYCDLTVCFERKKASDRDEKWAGAEAQNYSSVELDLVPYKEDLSRGSALVDYIKNNSFDILIFTNYISPATMRAIAYCRARKIKYYIEYDGGFYKKDRFPVSLLKKYLLCGANGHFTTCEQHIKYLLSLGIEENKIWKYPFTSVREVDIFSAQELSSKGKEYFRKKLGMPEEKIILSVGQFIHRKGFDVLLEATRKLNKNIGVYIVGGSPTKEYLNIQKEMQLDNVHFVGFKTKDELAEYYASADLYVMPTREDIWGLVINEAMAHGLPIISSDACIAALEMVKDEENGYIVASEDINAFYSKMQTLISNDEAIRAFSIKSLEIIEKYTIEKMAKRHAIIFEEVSRKEC